MASGHTMDTTVKKEFLGSDTDKQVSKQKSNDVRGIQNNKYPRGENTGERQVSTHFK